MKLWIVAALVFISWDSYSQSNLRLKKIILNNDTIKLDTLSVIPGTFKIIENKLDSAHYHIDWFKSLLILHREPTNDSVYATFRVYPINFNQTFAHKSKKNFSPDKQTHIDVFKYVGAPPGNDIFDTEGLNKTGSVSRGINFGNNQNLSVNSSLNLQLSGKIKDDINILASISDDNIPIQPDGNTAQLQDFDQVFIKVFTEKTSLIAGDFWMRRPQSYFLNYNKRVQGIQLAQIFDRSKKWKYSFDVGGALSKGKFSRNVFFGTEGNQGPYRLKGAENEPFIIVLAGTETVYIDGQLLQRGLENDYTIDYNTSEITFTPKNLITKDRRIIVEFQYSEKNYARSIVTTSHVLESAKTKMFFNVYSEQDSKSQPLQQTLSDDDKRIMAGVGDSIQDAFNLSIDSVAYSANQLLYKKVDSLGYDSVFVFSVNADSAFYKLQFTNVGAGNGDYVQSTFTALGRIYKWVAPDTVGGFIVHQGNFAPVVLLVTPKKRQMVTAGFEYKPNKTTRLYLETAFSNYDVNQYSKIHKANDDGFALKTGGEKIFSLKKDSTGNALELVTSANAEMVTQTFNRIERFRAVEFERNWNVNDALLNSDQLLADVGAMLRKKNHGQIGLSGNTFMAKSNYTGIMSRLNAQYRRRGWNLNGHGSYLMTDGLRNTAFLRHNTQLSKTIKRFVMGFNDIHEDNRFYKPGKTDSTIAGSYRFYDWEVYTGTSDTLGNRFTVNYRQRTDWLNDTGKISKASIGRQYGGTAAFMKNPKNVLRLRAGYRTLEIVDSTLIGQKADNTIVGRIEHDLKLAKNFFTSSVFYEVSSGLELKREFIYIEVPAGQGTYTWNDYNSNGIKELNEFEIAAYPDQATYIRTFTPSNTYVRTYNNSFSHNVSINPAYLIKASKAKGFKKFISKFADMAYYKIDRKTANDIPEQAFNPFRKDIADSSLQSVNSSIRNITYFNRSSSVFAVDYTVQQNTNKSLLSNGFELRKLYTNEVKTRLSIKRAFTLTMAYKEGQKLSSSDFLNGRNYKIDFYEVKPELAWQPGTNFRWSIIYSYLYKQNKLEGGGERTVNNNYGTEIRFSTAERGSIQANFNYVLIDYNGETNTALSFEMLDALKNGKNYTWSASWQQSLSKNLQLNLTYVGRKSENNKIIHTGGVQVRAFF
ncbi:MAG TPA: hypothetical protein VD905_03005 [Flavobacteriales bacterium]|nr:hypothetical protein [Flavobacteriales bacterium]